MTEADREHWRGKLEKCGRQAAWPAAVQLLRHPVRCGLPGARRLRSWRHHGRLRLATAVTFWDQEMVIALPEEVSVSLRRHGFFEYDLTACLLSLIRPGATVLDVGAHIGYFSVLAGALAGPGGRVVAFEPTPATLTVLRDNARRAGNVTVVPAAAWSTEGEVTLHDQGPGYSAYNSAFQARLPPVVRARVPVQVRKVRAIRLDDYVRQHALAVDLVKIDAESAESHVLRGMRTVLSERRPVISLEVGDLAVPGVPTSRELVDTLCAAGYYPYEPCGGQLARHEPRADYDYQNLIFLPEPDEPERTERRV